MYQPLQELPLLCQVCQEKHLSLFAVAPCPHRFCKPCSISYISQRAASLEIPRCLQEGCGAVLDKSLPVYKHLDRKTLHQLGKLQSLSFLKDNPDYAACKTPDCMDIFLASEGRCGKCKGVHCRKCLNLQHTGKCLQEDEEMKGLNYRKCPACRMWVEKSIGCRFINCKCGTQFCYSCGSPFASDPCRKRSIWEREMQIKQLMKNIRIQKPASLKEWMLLFPKLGLGFFLLVLIVAMVPIVAGLVIVMGALAALFTPLGIFYPLSRIQSNQKRWISCVLLVIFYPLLSALIMAGWIAAMVIYPCSFRCNHHGIYDLFNEGLVLVALGYLKVAHCLLPAN